MKISEDKWFLTTILRSDPGVSTDTDTSKLTDSDGEQEETCHWLRTATECKYLDFETGKNLAEQYHHVSAMLNKMMNNSQSWSSNDK